MTSESSTPGRALVRRFLDGEHEAIYARGDFADLAQAYNDHAALWGVAPDPLGELMMHQLLGGAVLYLSSRPLDESMAWTLNIAGPPMNLFATGSTVTRRVTGQFFADDVRVEEGSRLFVDSRRSQGSDRRSVIEVEGLDVLQIFEQYAAKSDQALARYFELAPHDYVMVASLPVGEQQWIQDLTREDVADRIDSLKPLDEREFWFQCGCNREKVIEVVASAWQSAADTLFGERETVDVTCPRCGRRWPVSRADLEEGGGEKS